MKPSPQTYGTTRNKPKNIRFPQNPFSFDLPHYFGHGGIGISIDGRNAKFAMLPL